MSCEDIIIEVENERIDIELTPEGADGQSLNPRGNWNAATAYHTRDLVAYQGGSYVAMKAVPAGTLPTNTAYWMVNASNATPYWGAIEGDIADQTDLQNALNAKADASAVYTKTQTDTLLDAKADANAVYTKTEADALLSDKADADDVYTKSQVDDALDLKADKADVYTQTELDGIFDGIDNALDTKADKSDTYTKTQTDTLLSAKADASAVYSKGETDSLLNAKANTADVYSKSQTYSKTEADSLLNAKANSADVYSKTQTDNLLSAKANSADLGSLADQDTVDYETEVTNKPTLGTMSAESADDYYDKDEVNDLINASGVVAELDASGSIATFETNLAENLSRLNVSIEPVQDLHGYDNPWPAGGGKNLFGLKTIDNNDKGYRLVSTAGSSQYTISGTSSNNSRLMISDEVTLPAGTYCFSCKFTGTVAEQASYLLALQVNNAWTGYQLSYAAGTYNATQKSGTVTLSEASTVQLAVACTSGCVIDGTISEIQFESGSSVTTWSPYSNICPISGHSSAVVTRTGKNFLDATTANRSDNSSSLTKSEGTVKLVNTSATRYCGFNLYTNPNFINKVLPKTTYTLSFDVSGTLTTNWSVGLRNYVTNTFVTAVSVTATGHYSVTFSTDVSDNCYLLFTRSGNSTADVDVTFSNIQLEVGSAESAYEPYSGTSLTIDLNGTRYGGTLDVLTGVLTVDRKLITLSDVSVFGTSGTGTGKFVTYDVGESCDITKSLVCERMKSITFAQRGQAYQCYISNADTTKIQTFVPSDATIESVNTALSGSKVAISLATPITVTLTPAQIQALQGLNNVWADTGNVALSYWDNSTAEAITDVKQMMADYTETMIAPRNLSVNEFVCVNQRLYKVTANVASGSTLTVGINVTETTVAEQLTYILSQLQ